jgi:long-chain acyl-CoA synthetase
VLCALPLHFHFVVSVLLFLVKRAVLFLPTATTGSFVSLLAHNDIDVVYGAPFHVELINQSAALRGKKLRRVISTSMALSDECAQNFYERFNFPLVQVLGNIEIGLPFVNLLWSKEQPTALGERVPGYEIKLVSVAGVHAVGSVICGELLIRGEGMFDCYLDPYRSRLSVCYDGWFATGDVLAMDSQGCYRFVGRTKSVINVGGLKVFPEEVEACILATGLVEEVRVYGVEHQIYGERIVAEVVAGSFDELALRRKLKERLARYKLPSEFVELEALGKTATGKVLRRRAV